MKGILNVIACVLISLLWLFALYYLVFIDVKEEMITIGIVMMLTMIVFINGIYCVGIKLFTKGLLTITWQDYLLTLFFGHFGCYRIRQAVNQSYAEYLLAKQKDSLPKNMQK